jgi:heme a synthase
MKSTRRLSIAALVVACLHLIFGAIVRISGSGLGCGENWPKCYGYWFPPFSRPDLIVEVSHRYLASILVITVLSMTAVAFAHRREPGVGGRGGVLRSALGSVVAVFAAAILGGVTVKMGNAPWATVAHWLVAMTLLALVATTAIRAGALGGASALVQRGTARAARSGTAAAVLAIFAVALGGLTAKYPGASVGCTTVPLCGANPAVEPAGVHIQLGHRTIAVLLVLHLIGVVMMLRKRRTSEAAVVVRAAHIALGMVLLQLVVASSMILLHLPPVLRSLHEATGVGIWLSCFVLAYLARRSARTADPAERAPQPAVVAKSVSPNSAGQLADVAPIETPAEAPKLTPLPPPTMAVIVARGADLL